MQLGGRVGKQIKMGSDPQFSDFSLTGTDEVEICLSGGAIEMEDLSDRDAPLSLGDSVNDVTVDKVDVLERVRRLCLQSNRF